MTTPGDEVGSASIEIYADTDRFATSLQRDMAAAFNGAVREANAAAAEIEQFITEAARQGLEVTAKQAEAAFAVMKQKAEQAAKDSARAWQDYQREVEAAAKAAAREQAAAAKEAQQAITAAAKDATKEQLAALKELEAEQQRLADEAKRNATEIEQALKAASDAATRAAREQAAAAREAAKEAAQAAREQSAAAAAAAREQAAAERANAERVSNAARIALTSFQADAARSEAALNRITSALSNVRDGLASLSSRALSEIAQNAQYAALAVGALGGGLIKVGLDQANQIQQATASFEAFAAQLQGGANAIDNFTDAQRKSIATNFVQQIQAIARETPLAQDSLIKDTQALVSLGSFTGAQAINALKTIGNALADVGQSGTLLNQNLDGIVVAFSQISGAGRLLAQDLNQITTRIPAASRTLVFEQIGKNLGLINDISTATPEKLKAVREEVLKLQKAGEIPSNVAIPSILQVLQQLPGASQNGVASALLRSTTQTLSGAFEAVKDTFKQDIGKAFQDTGNTLVPALLKLQDQIGPLIDNVAKPLSKLFTDLVNVILDNKDSITNGLGAIFHGLDTVITTVGPHLPAFATAFGLVSKALSEFGSSASALVGAGVLTAFINPIVGLTLALAGLSKSSDATNHLQQAFADLKPLVAPLESILSSLGQVVISLGPALEGLATVVAALTPALQLAAIALQGVADGISAVLSSKIGVAIGLLVTASGLTFIGLTALPGILTAITTQVDGLALGLAALDVELRPITVVVAAIVGIGAAAIYSYKQFESFRRISLEALSAVANFSNSFWNNFKNVSVGATAVVIDSVLQFVALTLEGFRAILKGLSYLPSWLGGGAFDAGVKSLSGIIDNINELQNRVDDFSNYVSSKGNIHLHVDTGNTQQAFDYVAAGVKDFNAAVAGTSTAMLDAAVSAQTLQGAINALPDLKRIQVEVEIFQTIGQQNSKFLTGALNNQFLPGAKTGLEDATGFSTEGIDAAFAPGTQNANQAAFNLNQIQAAKNAAAAAGQSAAQAAATTQKQITDSANKAAASQLTALATALRQIATQAASALKDISDKSADQIRTSFDKIVSDLREQGATALIANVRRVEDRLVSLADKRKVLNDQLTEATSKLTSLQSESKSFQDSIRNAILSLGDVANPTKGIAQTFLGISNTLTNAINQTRTFAANIAQLKTLGLNTTSLQQLIEKGPAEAGQAAAVLARSGIAGISQINALQAQLSSAADTFSASATNATYSAGIAAAKGLVAGLAAQENTLDKQMQKVADTLSASLKKHLNLSASIADGLAKGLEAAVERQTDQLAAAIVKSMKAKLKISSPSRVMFDEVGVPSGNGIVAGMVDAITRSTRASSVVAAGSSYASNITFGPGAISATGVTEDSASRMGAGLGLGITDVLERQQALAVINGHG